MNQQKLYELHVLGLWPTRFYVIDLRTGNRYQDNRFPKEMENLDLTYLNSIIEVIPEGKDAIPKEQGTYFICAGWWPFTKLGISFEWSKEEKERQEETRKFEDAIIMAGCDDTN